MLSHLGRWGAGRVDGLLLAFIAAVAAFLTHGVDAYDVAEEVVVSMNKVWPYANPTETYRYYDFPFCQPTTIMPHFMTLGQVLRGDRLVNSLYKMSFKQDTAQTSICNKTYQFLEIENLKRSIDQNYMFELFVTD